MARFAGLDIKTTGDTLIPRPETELLVEVCLGAMGPGARIADVGTGSGNIAIALTMKHRTCKIVALDTSEAALEVARENARLHGLSDRIDFIKSDLFAALAGTEYDIIVSNPPYVASWEIETLSGHVKAEPRLALDGGDDGLVFYRRIVEEAPEFLARRGLLIMEIGYGQMPAVKGLIMGSKNFRGFEVHKDFSNIYRVVKARRWTGS